MAKHKSFTLSDEMHRYLVGHGTPPDEIAADLIAETRNVAGDFALMQIAPEQGALMELLTSLIRPQFCVEIGTFTGYSALCVARALPPGGKLLCCDVSEEWTSVARSFWERAGVSDRIDLEIAPALETVSALPEEPTIDFAFIDADKESYIEYYEALLPRLTDRGLLLIDNVLWGGSVIDPDNNEPSTLAIRAFNDHVAADPRSEVVMIPVGDGISFIRRVS